MLVDKLTKWLSRPTLKQGFYSAVGMPVTLATDIGFHREENQDRVTAMRVNATPFSKTFAVVALADGMGGMINGADCASLTVAAFFNALIRFRQVSPMQRLELAANIANAAVYEFSKGSGGATLSAFLITADQGAFTLNVGDSRIYATIAEDKIEKVIRLTIDDSLEEAVGGHGRELLQFMGMGVGLKAHIGVVPEKAGRLLVTSDGIHFINQESLSDALRFAQGPPEVAEQLVTLAKWRGAPDNASLAITLLPEAYQSVSSPGESGVEIWDPFGALHVMWIRSEHVEAPMTPIIAKEKITIADEKPSSDNATPRSNPKKSRKLKSPKSRKKPAGPSDAPQLEIELIPMSIKGKIPNDNDYSE